MFFNQLTIHKVIIKVRHSFVIGTANATFKNFYVPHSTTRFLRDGEKYHIYFVAISLTLPTVEEFPKIG